MRKVQRQLTRIVMPEDGRIIWRINKLALLNVVWHRIETITNDNTFPMSDRNERVLRLPIDSFVGDLHHW